MDELHAAAIIFAANPAMSYSDVVKHVLALDEELSRQLPEDKEDELDDDKVKPEAKK